MTDGWYSIRVKLDEYLQNLMKERKIYIGQKLYIQGAELCGSDQAVSPLEVSKQQHPTSLLSHEGRGDISFIA